MSSNGPRRVVLGAIVAAAVLVACCLAVGCGAASRSDSAASSVKAVTFAVPAWGIRLQYPSSYVRVEPKIDQQADPGLLYQVYFADPTGAKSKGRALDVLGISIHKMSKAASPGDVRKYRRNFAAIGSQLIGKPDGLRMVQPYALTRLGGHSALKGTYAYRLAGRDVAAVVYLVPIGDRVYWISGQASRRTWGQAGRSIGAAVATLRLTPSQ